jgi:hypothetical protein
VSSAAIIGGIGAAVAIGGTIYGIAQSNAAIDAANSVKLPKFTPIDIKGLFGDPDAPGGPLENLGMVGATDMASLFQSQLDFKTRYPQLAEAKDATIQNALEGSQGKAPKAISDALAVAGVNRDISKNPFEQARDFGFKDPLTIEKGNRNAYSNAISLNPEVQVGATGSDVVNAMEANTGGSFAFNESLFGAKMDAYNASLAQGAQNVSAITGTIGGLASIGQNMYQNYQLSQALNSDPSLNSDYWRTNASKTNYAIPGGYTPIG